MAERVCSLVFQDCPISFESMSLIVECCQQISSHQDEHLHCSQFHITLPKVGPKHFTNIVVWFLTETMYFAVIPFVSQLRINFKWSEGI